METLMWTEAERTEIAFHLEEYHEVFNVFWALASVECASPSSKIKTAAIVFPPRGRPRMVINRTFWNLQNHDGRMFVLAHECLHVILDHGVRNASGVVGATPRLINIAQDITINEIYRDMFGTERELIIGWEKYCWIDTCFDDWQSIERHRSFTYYLEKLIEQGTVPEVELVDDHEHDDGEGAYADDDVDLLAGKLAQSLSWDELQKIIAATEKSWGRGVHGSPYEVALEALEPSELRIQDLIARLKRTAKGGKREKFKSTFARESRRYSTLGPKFVMPGTIAKEHPKQKLLAATFFDVSGSCMSYFNHFMRINAAFQEDEETFELRTFKFDTSVQEMKVGEKITVGGGTSFDIIERKCLELQAEIGRYPDVVFVVTDGGGNRVVPLFPGRWIWLLTDGAKHSYISTESRWCPLKKVVF